MDAEPDVAALAPEAPGQSWWPTSFLAPSAVIEPFVLQGLAAVSAAVAALEAEVQVDIPTETARGLQSVLEPGTHVAITPRNARVFLPGPEYVI